MEQEKAEHGAKDGDKLSPPLTNGDKVSPVRACLRPITVEDLPALRQAAGEDEHRVVAPTHVIVRGERIVGYVSIGAMCLVNAWVDSRTVVARESVECLREAERLAFEAGAQAVCLPCAVESPFMNYMGKLGYTRLGLSTYNVKLAPGNGRAETQRKD